MHPLYGDLPVLYVPLRVTSVLWSHIGILIRFIASEPQSTTGVLFYRTVSLWNDLACPVFDGVGLAGFKSSYNAFFIGQAVPSFFVFYKFPFLFFLSTGWYCGAGVFGLM